MADDVGAGGLAEGEYTFDNIQRLSDHHIRRRPSMYIGNSGLKGLHFLANELITRSHMEALAGYCRIIAVEIATDGCLSVSDDGQGIPVDVHPKLKKSTLELLFTCSIGVWPCEDVDRPFGASVGVHYLGVMAVTVLSKWLDVEVCRNGTVWRQEYVRGEAITEVRDFGAAAGRTGTRVRFLPDAEIFGDTQFDYGYFKERLRALAFLTPGLRTHLDDKRTGQRDDFHSSRGVADFVAYLNRDEDVLHPPISITETRREVHVEIALQYTTGERERVRCYGNHVHNRRGGTHRWGFLRALTLTLKDQAKRQGLFKNNQPPTDDAFRAGLTAVISVQVPEPHFDSQEKRCLWNQEVQEIVAAVVYKHLRAYLTANPKVVARIVKKIAHMASTAF